MVRKENNVKKKLLINFEGKPYNVNVEIIEPRATVMSKIRTDKLKSFYAFRKWYGKRVFESFFKSNQATLFNNIYKDNITDQINIQVINERFFAVFWGTRPYDSEIRLDGDELGIYHRVLLDEHGAQLIYNQMDDGRVCVCLYRAETERGKKDNDYILIDDISNPRKLLDKKRLKKHWNKLLTCMENTCIEFKPSFYSRFKMFWMNINYPYTEKDRMNVRRIFSWSGKLILFLIPILFSGIGLTIISYVNQKINPSPVEREIENQKEILNVLRNIEQKSNYIDETLKLNIDVAKKIAQYDSASVENNKFVIKTDSMIKELINQSNKLTESELKELRLLRQNLKK